MKGQSRIVTRGKSDRMAIAYMTDAGIAGVGCKHRLNGPDRVDDAENAARDNEIERKHF